jgi:hypothetical protein
MKKYKKSGKFKTINELLKWIKLKKGFYWYHKYYDFGFYQNWQLRFFLNEYSIIYKSKLITKKEGQK